MLDLSLSDTACKCDDKLQSFMPLASGLAANKGLQSLRLRLITRIDKLYNADHAVEIGAALESLSSLTSVDLHIGRQEGGTYIGIMLPPVAIARCISCIERLPLLKIFRFEFNDARWAKDTEEGWQRLASEFDGFFSAEALPQLEELKLASDWTCGTFAKHCFSKAFARNCPKLTTADWNIAGGCANMHLYPNMKHLTLSYPYPLEGVISQLSQGSLQLLEHVQMFVTASNAEIVNRSHHLELHNL